jgi:hypothetical protein
MAQKEVVVPSPHHHEFKELLAKGEVSLQLDTYDDIFSDFDPRPYSSRALSVDFLGEATRATREKSGQLELRFLIPQHERKKALESVIKKRLRAHFERHVVLLKKEHSEQVEKGIIVVIVGFLLMLGATSCCICC